MSFTESTRERFRILRPLAAGGYANVYLAQQLDLDRQVAVKVLRTEDVEGEAQRHRFIAEARITAALSHPNIVQVLDFGLAGTHPWIAYEYLPGKTLEQILRDGPMTWREAVDAAVQVARALSEAHGKGIVHRDIKPENVMRVDSGGYKVADFGIAKWQGASVKTSAGLILGTPDYMSPEHIRGADPTPQFDIYALGAMLYELLVGRAPFHEKNVSRVLQGHLKVEPKPVRVSCPDAPRELEDVVRTCLAKEPQDRYASARDLEQALLAIAPASAPVADLGRTQETARPVPRSGVRSRKMTLPISSPPPPPPSVRKVTPFVVAAMLAGGLAWLAATRGPGAAPSVAGPAPSVAATPEPRAELDAALKARLTREFQVPAGHIRAKLLEWIERFTSVDGMLATELDVDSDYFRSELEDFDSLLSIEQALDPWEKRLEAGEVAGPDLEILRLRVTAYLFMCARNMKLMRDAIMLMNKPGSLDQLDEIMRKRLGLKDVGPDLEFRCMKYFSRFLEAYPRGVGHAAGSPAHCEAMAPMLEDVLHVTRHFSRAQWRKSIKTSGLQRIEALRLRLEASSKGDDVVALAHRLSEDLVAHVNVSGQLARDRQLYRKTRGDADQLARALPCAREMLLKTYQIILKDPAGPGRG